MAEAKQPKPSKGRRRPKEEDIQPILDAIIGGASLRKACADLGIDWGHADRFILADADLRQRYAHARGLRSDLYAERGMTLSLAAATGQSYEGHKIDAAGARVALDAIKWYTAKMSPTAYGEKLALVGGSENDAPIQAEVTSPRDRAKALALLVAKQKKG